MPRARALPWLGLLGLLLSAAGPATAQTEAQPNVVFFAPLQLDAELRNALEDALSIQLALLPARLQYELRATPLEAIEKRIEGLRHVAREHAAVALFWLEVRPADRWILYAIDPHDERVIVRQLGSKPESPEAMIEAVALIVRATSDALMHGQPLPAPAATPEQAEPDTEKPPTPWPVVPAVEPSSSLRLAAGYMGTTFARKFAQWQHGLALRAAWLWPSGPYLGAGFAFLERAEFSNNDTRFELDRYPISLHAGLRFRVDSFTFSAELGAEIELRNRRTLRAPANTRPEAEGRRVVYSVCPKLEAEYTVLPWLRVFANLGLDFVLGNFPYNVSLKDSDTGETMEYVVAKPHWMRLTAQLGVGIVR